MRYTVAWLNYLRIRAWSLIEWDFFAVQQEISSNSLRFVCN